MTQKTLRMVIEIQVPASGGLEAAAKELQSVQDLLTLGHSGVACISAHHGYNFRTEELDRGDAAGFPAEAMHLTSEASQV